MDAYIVLLRQDQKLRLFEEFELVAINSTNFYIRDIYERIVLLLFILFEKMFLFPFTNTASSARISLIKSSNA